MATSTASLTTINVFPTEALYNSNKGSIGAAEISLVKDTGSSSLDAARHAVIDGTATLLWRSANTEGGNWSENTKVNLSQSFKNFKYLVLAVAFDRDNSGKWFDVVDTKMLDYFLSLNASTTDSNIWPMDYWIRNPNSTGWLWVNLLYSAAYSEFIYLYPYEYKSNPTYVSTPTAFYLGRGNAYIFSIWGVN